MMANDITCVEILTAMWAPSKIIETQNGLEFRQGHV